MNKKVLLCALAGLLALALGTDAQARGRSGGRRHHAQRSHRGHHRRHARHVRQARRVQHRHHLRASRHRRVTRVNYGYFYRGRYHYRAWPYFSPRYGRTFYFGPSTSYRFYFYGYGPAGYYYNPGRCFYPAPIGW